MSTSAQIDLVDNDGSKLSFYCHCDGYPEGVVPHLKKFVGMIKDGKIRNNLLQSAGWLLVIGKEAFEEMCRQHLKERPDSGEITRRMYGWKVGLFESIPTDQDFDCDYHYVVNVETCEISQKKV